MAENIDLLFTVADASKSDILNTFKALQTTINSSYADIKYKVDPSAKAEIEALTAALKDMNTISQKNGGKTGSTKSAATKEAKEVEAAYNKILALQKQISKAEVKLLNPKNTQADIASLNKTIQELSQKKAELQKDFGSKFSEDQNSGINNAAKNAEAALENARQKVLELQQAASQKVQFGLDLGTFEANIDAIEKKFNVLKNAPDGVKDKIAELRTALAQMASASASGDYGGMLTAFQQYNTVLQSLKQNYSTAANAEKEFEKATRDAAAAAAQAEAEAAAAAALMAKNSADAAALQERVATALKDTSPAALAYRGKLKEIADGLREVKNESDMSVAASKIATLTQSLDETERSISRLQGAFGKIKGFLKTGMTQLFGISSGFMAFRKAAQEVKQMYGEVVKIDSSMINLRKVTDETEDTYDSFLKSASKDAQKLGTTISGLVDQTATWAKLGYTVNEAADLSKISTMYEKVGEVSGETAVSDMVTALKAFNLEASDAITVVDRLNELGNNYAVSAADLGDALSRSASALHMAGTSMDQTLAMITGGSEITQKPSEMGNFLKIAVMRIRGMKGELEDLGEEVSDSVDSISKVQTQILNLTHGKVNIFDDEGEFRNYYEIMKEISALWDELSSKERASLSEILFGKVRSNQGFALLQAFQSGQIEKALKTAQNSAGSAAKEYENWMGGLEAKTEQFKAAYQDLAQTVVNSDWAKSIVDSGTQALNMLTSLIDKVGVLPVALGGGALAMLPKFISNFGKQYCPAWV